MNFIADTHTHTVASGHAYSTITENLRYASEQGYKFLCCTDHTTTLPGAPHYFYFTNLRSIPDEMFGVYLIHGCEVNIIDESGALDLDDWILKRLDWVIASLHDPCIKNGMDADYYTNAWLAAANNPLIDVIGHSGDERFPFDHERAIKAFKECGKVVEINSHSFKARPGSPKNCTDIARLCKKHSVPIVVSSDAHFYTKIGSFDDAVKMLTEIDFPDELILNSDYDRFAEFLTSRTGREFPRI